MRERGKDSAVCEPPSVVAFVIVMPWLVFEMPKKLRDVVSVCCTKREKVVDVEETPVAVAVRLWAAIYWLVTVSAPVRNATVSAAASVVEATVP